MTVSELKQRAAEALNIKSLNALQETVAHSDARDMTIIAPTGSGKTLAFVIAILNRINTAEPHNAVSALILAPSRELVIQIYEVTRRMALPLKTVALYGGRPMTSEVGTLAQTPDIVVATPGRLLDHLIHRNIDLSSTRVLVIDEYDKSLELGFQDQMSRIVKRLSRVNTKILTSATRLDPLPDFIDQKRAQILDFSETSSPRERMVIMEVESPEADKLETLASLIRSVNARRMMVFVNHRESAERVAAYLKKQKIDTTLYHGGLDQQDREIAVAQFDSEGSRVMVSTDLAGRGLDITDVDAVTHYHMPVNVETWTHRCGRTARVDAAGEVYVIVGPRENVPEYIDFDRQYYPDGSVTGPVRAERVTLYINAGKRDKISRGDIAGFAMKQAGVAPDKVGAIKIFPNYSLVSVSPDAVSAILTTARSAKLKTKRVLISQIQ